ncbi:FxSxx-COOH system tetratricopeptide repeat protein [Streptomyces sp. Go-475]|uniref:FxSxx-COOH system tetratricopeptide repeat protein n=1 Tax=Streptomyces sp. Go-475 TaxID=2072505 RepID=UPI000DEF97FB|nr:FxSxx-COOH system tetratricopeptide repeat protein [Streptomyces sp. Go-475]AXE90731.1 NB-ARC domain protein [Streptomyces sp. Go-475]
MDDPLHRQDLKAARDGFVAGRDLHVHLAPERPTDASLKAEAASLLNPPLGRLPPQVHGRDALLQRLQHELDEPSARVHLLCGLGGVGKSTVALHVAAHARRQGRSVWWVYASNASTLVDSMLALAAGLGAGAGEVEAARAGRLDPSDVLWRQLEMRSGWLLVFDNADDVAALSVSGRLAGDGNGWLRISQSGTILITSRDGHAHHWGAHTLMHPLPWLSDEAGARILLDLAPRCGSSEDAQRLSSRVGGLPLALHHIGYYLSSPFAPEESFAELSDVFNERFSGVLATGVHRRELVTQTWGLSLQQLARQSIPQARSLLEVLARFAPGVPLPVRLLSQTVLAGVCKDEQYDGVRQGLEALHHVGLVEVRDTPGSTQQPAWSPGVVLHPLVAEVFRRCTDDIGTGCPTGDLTTSAAVKYAQEILGAADCGDPEDAGAWSRFGQLTSHFEELVTAVSSCGSEKFRTQALKQCRYLYLAGYYARARDLADRIITHWRYCLPEDHLDLQVAQNRLGAALTMLDENVRAKEIFEGILRNRVRTLEEGHRDVLTIKNNLAVAIKNLGEYVTARDLLREVTQQSVHTMGPADPFFLRVQDNLAKVLILMGEFEEAYTLSKDVLSRRQVLLGPQHPDTLGTAHRLGQALYGLERYKEAHANLLRSLRDCERVIGSQHPETMTVASDLARVIWDIGDHASAVSLLAQVTDRRHRLLGAKHPDYIQGKSLLTCWMNSVERNTDATA